MVIITQTAANTLGENAVTEWSLSYNITTDEASLYFFHFITFLLVQELCHLISSKSKRFVKAVIIINHLVSPCNIVSRVYFSVTLSSACLIV